MEEQKKSLTLEELREQFEQWRKNKLPKERRIPEQMWEAAVELSSKYPFALIVKELRLNRDEYKRRLGLKKQNQPTQELMVKSDFVEIPVHLMEGLYQHNNNHRCEKVELERADGTKMRLYAANGGQLEAISLIKVFLGVSR
jgi:hypothetical protein